MANSKSNGGCGCFIIGFFFVFLVQACFLGNIDLLVELLVYGDFSHLEFGIKHIVSLIVDALIIGVILFIVITDFIESRKKAFNKKVEEFHRQKEVAEKSQTNSTEKTINIMHYYGKENDNG